MLILCKSFLRVIPNFLNILIRLLIKIFYKLFFELKPWFAYSIAAIDDLSQRFFHALDIFAKIVFWAIIFGFRAYLLDFPLYYLWYCWLFIVKFVKSFINISFYFYIARIIVFFSYLNWMLNLIDNLKYVNNFSFLEIKNDLKSFSCHLYH